MFSPYEICKNQILFNRIKQQQQQRLEDVISNLAQTLPLSQRNGCLEKIDSEYKSKSPLFPKALIPVNTLKDQSTPFKIFTLRCAFQAICGYQNLFYRVWIDFKSSKFVLPCSIRQESQNIAYDNTLIEPHHEVKNNTATPR